MAASTTIQLLQRIIAVVLFVFSTQCVLAQCSNNLLDDPLIASKLVNINGTSTGFQTSGLRFDSQLSGIAIRRPNPCLGADSPATVEVPIAITLQVTLIADVPDAQPDTSVAIALSASTIGIGGASSSATGKIPRGSGSVTLSTTIYAEAGRPFTSLLNGLTITATSGCYSFVGVCLGGPTATYSVTSAVVTWTVAVNRCALTILSGDGQTAFTNGSLRDGLVVRSSDGYGHDWRGGSVAFSISPSGIVGPTPTIDVANGRATGYVQLGSTEGPYTITATHSLDCSPRTAVFTATAVPFNSVTSITFQPVTQGATLDSNAGQGSRVFPEKSRPTDAMAADTVLVVVRGTPNTTFSLRAYDVDDPTADSTIDPNGGSGNDNLGGTEFMLNASSVTTNNLGVASPVIFRVTRQPGDNFMIVAAAPGAALPAGPDTVPALRTSGSLARSEMLTVWRTLHLQVDTMTAVSGNYIPGTIVAALPSFLLFSTDLVLATAVPDPRRFAIGVIPNINANNAYAVARIDGDPRAYNVTSVNRSTVRLAWGGINMPPSLSPTVLVGKNVKLFDDDDMNNKYGSQPTGDEGELFSPPDLSLLRSSVFSPAYIELVPEGVTGPTKPPFKASLPEGQGVEALFPACGYCYNQRPRDDDYWNVFLMSGYQGWPSLDADGESGRQRGRADSQPGTGAVVFNETLRDDPYLVFRDNPATTAAHEVGHLIGGDHSDGGLMADGSSRGTATQLSNRSILRMRCHSWIAKTIPCLVALASLAPASNSIADEATGAATLSIQVQAPPTVAGVPVPVTVAIANLTDSPVSIPCIPTPYNGLLQVGVRSSAGQALEVRGPAWGLDDGTCTPTTIDAKSEIVQSFTLLSDWSRHPSHGDILFDRSGQYEVSVGFSGEGAGVWAGSGSIEIMEPGSALGGEWLKQIVHTPILAELAERGSMRPSSQEERELVERIYFSFRNRAAVEDPLWLEAIEGVKQNYRKASILRRVSKQ